ncbi:MAG: hypothetical protein ACFE85_03070 [Candidatus Hodarchaeota archaeon]
MAIELTTLEVFYGSFTLISVVIARTFVIISSICFYIGYTLPKFIKKLFIKS